MLFQPTLLYVCIFLPRAVGSRVKTINAFKMWKQDIIALPSIFCFSLRLTLSQSLLIPSLPSVMHFNSVWGDTMIDRLSETGEIIFFLNVSLLAVRVVCVKCFIFCKLSTFFTVPWALQWIAFPHPPAPNSRPPTPSPETWPAPAVCPDVEERERQGPTGDEGLKPNGAPERVENGEKKTESR